MPKHKITCKQMVGDEPCTCGADAQATVIRQRTLRTKISEILIKWSMPTRQVAISEIIKLFEDEKESK